MEGCWVQDGKGLRKLSQLFLRQTLWVNGEEIHLIVFQVK